MYSGSSQIVYCPSYYFDDSFTSTRCLYLSQSQLWVIKRISTSYARAHAHTRPRAYACGRTLASRLSTQTMLGGEELSLQTLSSEERLRHAPFLTVLGERERERERERDRASVVPPPTSGTAQTRSQEHRCRAGAVCSAVVAHRTISQVRPPLPVTYSRRHGF